MSLAAVLALTACGRAPASAAHPRASGPKHAVSIHLPETLGALDVGVDPTSGRMAAVACATCHGPAGTKTLAATLQGKASPHEAAKLEHGELACNACHDPADRSRLRLADGRSIGFADTMQLCGQCHGLQLRDYRNGAHGGMTGFWDLTRGARQRNHCVDCHAPHAPKYPMVRPAAPPRDRRPGDAVAANDEAHR